MTEPRRYGCFNRAAYADTLVVQDGWDELQDGFGNPVRSPRWKRIPHRMSTECGYARDPMGVGPADQRCAGCRWKQVAA